MISRFFRLAARRFAEPTFTHRNSFSGAHYFRCNQTGHDYGMIPAGLGGYLVSRDGALLGKAETFADASATITADARAAIRALPVLAAA
jgi:hypothetical protein